MVGTSGAKWRNVQKSEACGIHVGRKRMFCGENWEAVDRRGEVVERREEAVDRRGASHVHLKCRKTLKLQWFRGIDGCRKKE